MARDMMLTVEEYMALRRLIESERESEGASLDQKPKRRRRDPKLKRALREANAKLRNKNGSLKKGKTQGDVMRLAHKLKKRM